MEYVKCTKCAEEKPLSAFHKDKSRRNGIQPHCKECDAIKGRLRRYGITKQRFTEMWDAQAGRCAICFDHLTLGDGGCAVDHNHLTGEVRGLLCTKCNHALGLFKDSPSVLEAATAYLKVKGHYGRSGSKETAVQ